LCRELPHEFNAFLENIAWPITASFVLLSSPMLFAPPVVNQFDKGFGLEEA